MMETDVSQLNFINSKCTGAAAFHVSSTVDWSSISAQIKNQVVLVPAVEVVRLYPNPENVHHTGPSNTDAEHQVYQDNRSAVAT